MNTMNEAQAWTFLADKWDNASPSGVLPIPLIDAAGYTSSCLCYSIMYLKFSEKIDSFAHLSMRDKIRAYGNSINGFGYYWPRNMEGAKQRAEFCRKQAELLTPKLTDDQLTEIKAWEFVALSWENATENSEGDVTAKYNNKQFKGMCRFILQLRITHIIPYSIRYRMIEKIEKALYHSTNVFLADFTFEGAKVRINFCREQIEKIKQGK